MYTISLSTKHFSTFEKALDKAVKKQHVLSKVMIVYKNGRAIAQLNLDHSTDIIIDGTFITHFNSDDFKNAKDFVFY